MGNSDQAKQDGTLPVADSIVSQGVKLPTETERQQLEEQLRLDKTLAETLITLDTQVAPEQCALSVDDVGIFSLDDIHAVKAKQKNGKTTVLKVCTAALMAGRQFRVKSELEHPRVLWLDTEQKRADVKLILTDIMAMAGIEGRYLTDHLHLHALRGQDYDTLYALLLRAIDGYEPQVVFIDGIVEFVSSFNDEAIAKKMVHDLQVLSSDRHCAVVCVLHTNKADEDHNMRGHLGTMLAQKSGTVLECRKQDRIITVRCTESRHAEAPDWSICFDGNGLIVDADEQRQLRMQQRQAEQQQKRQDMLEKEKQQRLKMCQRILTDKGGVVSRKQLTEILINVLDRKRPTVAAYISEWLKDGSIVEIDGMIQLSDDSVLPF